MAILPDQCWLTDCRTGGRVLADHVELSPELAADALQEWWKSDSAPSAEDMSNEDDFEWDWPALATQVKTHLLREATAIQIPGQDAVQGAMLLRLRAYSYDLDPPKLAVKIEYLATAPWNRIWLVGQQRYAGVGTAMILRAAMHSHLLAADGVVLDAVPQPRTVGFYKRRGFGEIAKTPDGIIKMQMSSDTVRSVLAEKGLLQ